MVTYVDNENFNLLCALTVRFSRIVEESDEAIGQHSEWDNCSDIEYIERVRNGGEEGDCFLDLLKYRKLRNIYCEKIFSYFNVDKNIFAKDLADYLTSTKSEKYVVSEYTKTLLNNEVTFLLVHAESESNFENFEENEKIYLITAWLKNYASESDNYVNLINPFCGIILNGKQLYYGSKVYSHFKCFDENAYYDSQEFVSLVNVLYENREERHFEYVVADNYDSLEPIEEFLDNYVIKIANSIKVDPYTFPCFEEEINDEENSEYLKNYRKWYRLKEKFLFRYDFPVHHGLEDIETMYYLENKHLFEFK